MKKIAKACSSHTSALGLGLWTGAWLIRKEAVGMLVGVDSMASTAESLAFIGAAAFAIGAAGWIALDARERDWDEVRA